MYYLSESDLTENKLKVLKLQYNDFYNINDQSKK